MIYKFQIGLGAVTIWDGIICRKVVSIRANMVVYEENIILGLFSKTNDI